MQLGSDLGAQELPSFLSSSSSSSYALGTTLVVLIVVLLLMGVTRRLVKLLLWRLTPDWIDGVTTLLLATLLVGQIAIVITSVRPELPYVWPILLILILIMASLLPANPVSDSVAFVRLRRAKRYAVGDLITVADERYGRVVLVRPLYTQLETPTKERVRVPNSVIVRRPIIVHQPEGTAAAGLPLPPAAVNKRTVVVTATKAPAPLAQPLALPLRSQGIAEAASEKQRGLQQAIAEQKGAEQKGVDQTGAEQASVEPAPPQPVAVAVSAIQTQLLPLTRIPPLRKRRPLGAISIRSLIRE